MSQPFRTSNWKLAQFLWIGLGYDLDDERMAQTEVIRDVYGTPTVFFLFLEDLACRKLSERYKEAGSKVHDLIAKAIKENP